MKYLVYSLEDDKNIQAVVKKALEKDYSVTQDGYEVVCFNDGRSFLDGLKERIPHVVLLDLMLPDIQGLDILKEVRADSRYDDIQIIIVSARSQTIDKVEGLDLGADDYLEKPFDYLELQSRVDAKIRRLEKQKTIEAGKIKIDIGKHTVEVDGQEISLTNAEFVILSELLKHKGNAVSRDEILYTLWGNSGDYESRTVDVHINSLRNKLGEEGKKIVSVWGIGYRFDI